MAVDMEKLKALIVRIGTDPHVENLGTVKLWKLIYFVDATALRELGHTLTGSEFIKYEHGPVPSRGEKGLKQLDRAGAVRITQERFPNYRLDRVVVQAEPSNRDFSAAEQVIIGEVCRAYGGRTATFLSELSHREPAWHYASLREKLSPELMLYGSEEDPDDL